VIVCVLLPRFALAVAAGGRRRLLDGPAALAPEPGGVAAVGEVTLAAEAFGIHAGMRLSEALARCPVLALVPPDPAGVVDAWERVLMRLEGIGAGVESPQPGRACFDARGLRRLHGGSPDAVLAAARRAVRGPARIGAAPTRFCALAAAVRARARRAEVVGGGEEGARAYLAGRPVALLRGREETRELPDPLARLGIRTLGELAALRRDAVADRFGAAGLLALDLARGRDAPPVPRAPAERMEEALELPEAGSGVQLGRALGLLVDRLLARRERRGRTLRAVVLGAALVEGGTWRVEVPFREALAEAGRMRLALEPRLALLPAPAERLRLTVARFGPPAADQRTLVSEPAAARERRLREGVRQARAAAGPDAALRVLVVDPDSRVPERRAVLAPYEP